MRHRYLLAFVLLLTACGGEGDTPQAVDTATLAPLTGRERSLILAAESASRQNNMEAAERDYLGAIEASTGQVEAHVALAQLYLRMKQPTKAQAILEKATALQPKNPGANYLLGKLLLGAGNHEAALAAFTAGRASAPDDLDLINGAGIANDMLGNHAAAQALYQPALSRNKGRSLTALRTNLAMSYLLSSNAKRALPLLKEEAKQPNASPVIRHDLALAYGVLGQPELARKALGKDEDEDARVATLARLKAYLADTSPTKKPPVLAPATATAD